MDGAAVTDKYHVAPVQPIATDILLPQDKDRILQLWNAEYGAQLQKRDVTDLQAYFDALNRLRHYLLRNEENEIVAWAATFSRDNARWFAIIIARTWQRQGLGAQLLQALKQNENELNGWVVDHHNDRRADGTPYISPMGFYLVQGFIILPEERLETPQISAVRIRWRRIG